MKKYFNKLLALVIATVIILTFSAVPAFASGSGVATLPATSPDAVYTQKTITVANAYRCSGVRAYQIVKGKYKDGKLTGYELCDSANAPLSNITAPKASELITIANNIRSGTANLAFVQMTKSGSTYTATVEAGEYIIIASSSGNTLYNPAVVSVSVTDANLLTTSDNNLLNMNSQFSDGDTAYMKKSSAIISKRIARADNTYGRVNAASFGNAVNFRVSTSIPSYSDFYVQPMVTITDNLNCTSSINSPFLGVNGLTVKVGTGETLTAQDEVAAGANTYTVYYYDKDGHKINVDNNNNVIYNPTAESLKQAVKYEIEFADAFIRANGAKNVEITYSSILTENAQLAVKDYSNKLVPNKTQVRLRYIIDPTNVNSSNSYYSETDETSTYTFGIDSGNDGGIKTYELNKVTQAGGTYESVPNSNNETTKKSPYALAGATFTIYSDRAMTQDQDHIIGTATSDANGHIEFRGLGPGTYYIKETAAPSDYTLNENNYKIVIYADLPSSGSSDLASYRITTYLMGTTDTQIGLASYNYSGNSITPTVTPAEIVNTRLATLPTTGGVGTIVISVVAGLGMAIFLTVFVISKKKKAKKIDTPTID